MIRTNADSNATSSDLIDAHRLNLIEARLKVQLDRRKENGSFRQLLPLSSSASRCNKYDNTPVKVGSKFNNNNKHKINRRIVDFSSNDYLGLARCRHQEFLVSQEFQRMCSSSELTSSADLLLLGATGSRLLSGDSYYARQLEQSLAHFHNRPSGVLFNSGYDANLSVLSSIPLPNDFVLVDELVHNSIIMGLRMGRCKQIFHFQHNSVKDLERLLCHIQAVTTNEIPKDSKETTRPKHSLIFVVVESVYSMDGDVSPLIEITSLLEKFPNTSLIVDEAHSLGVYGRTNMSDMMLPDDQIFLCSSFGEQALSCCSVTDSSLDKRNVYNGGGTGVLAALGLERHPSLLCSVHTFGKGAGCHGAFVATSATVVEYLVNYARPLIYSTALPPHSLASIRCAYESMTSVEIGDDRRKRLFHVVHLFRSLMLHKNENTRLLPSPSPIQCILIPGNYHCIRIAKQLQSEGFDVYPIRSPTIPQGKERIRIILHAHNTADEVSALVNTLAKLLGQYIDSSSLVNLDQRQINLTSKL